MPSTYGTTVALPAPEITVVTDGLRFPEGPVWMPDGSIVLVEIESKKLTRVAPDGKKTTIAQMSGGPNGAALGSDGMIYVTNNGGFEWHESEHGLFPGGKPRDYVTGRIERVDPKTGKIETLYDKCDGKPLRGPNDLVIDVAGDFYFTDLGKRSDDEVQRGGVYYARRDGSLIKRIAGPTMTANGCALSPDGKILYFVETEGARLWAVDLLGPGRPKVRPFRLPIGVRFVAHWGGRYNRFDAMPGNAGAAAAAQTL